VLVKPIHDVTKSSSIYIIEKAKPPIEGIVVEIGDGMHGVEMQIKKGDRILFGRSSGYDIKELGEEGLMMKMGDILAVLEDDVKVTMR